MFLCIITLRNKTVAHTFLWSFDNTNSHLCQERMLRSRNVDTMVTWCQEKIDMYDVPLHYCTQEQNGSPLTFLWSFDNANGHLCQERVLRSRNFDTMVTWCHTSSLYKHTFINYSLWFKKSILSSLFRKLMVRHCYWCPEMMYWLACQSN